MDDSLRKVIDAPYDETLARVPAALQTEGFGVLTEIDVKATLHKKLGVDFRRYKILGACNPGLAHQALQADLEVGLMLPCNVVVYEDGPRTTVVMAIDPTQTIAAQGQAGVRSVAEAVRTKLQRVIERV